MSYLRSFSALCMVALPVALFGCVGATDSQDGPENLGEAESALCTDSGLSGLYTGALTMGEVAGSVGSTSPSTTYGVTACPSLYVVEATSTNGKPNLAAEADYASSVPTTQSLCQATHVQATFYGWNGSSWTTISSGSATGTWNGSSCTVPYVAIGVSNTYSSVRVAAKAYNDTIFGPNSRLIANSVNAHY